MGKVIDASEISLGIYLSKNQGSFNIPFTQRPYTWEKEDVIKLLEDIIIMVYENRGEDYVHVVNFLLFIIRMVKNIFTTGNKELLHLS